MYNRYIPQDTSYTQLGTGEPLRFKGESRENGAVTGRIFGVLNGIRELFAHQSGEHRTLSGILKKLDSGDILLLLIAILLFVEGEDVDLAVALGLVFLLGLGDGDSRQGQ